MMEMSKYFTDITLLAACQSSVNQSGPVSLLNWPVNRALKNNRPVRTNCVSHGA